MVNWTGGYTSDVEYTASYHRFIEPEHLRLSALVGRFGFPERPLRYCELGTGRGVTAMTIAAANPDIEVHATDFAPGQIAEARRLSREAGLGNVHFYDDSFGQFRRNEAIPAKFDVIVLHGIYSWVDESVRRDIVGFIDERLEAGGICYVSYNAQPGWSAAAPTRHLMYMVSQTLGGASTDRLKSSRDLVSKLAETEARYFKESGRARGVVEKLVKQDKRYVVHEFLNDAWELFYHSDVVADMADARLDYIGTASLLERVDALNVTPAQAEVIKEVADPVLREVVRDFMMNTQFRRDVFARGASRLSAGEASAAWSEMVFTLVQPRDRVELKATGARGEGNLDEALYVPVLDALEKGPRSGQQLAQVVKDAGGSSDQLIQVLVVLNGKGCVMPRGPLGDGEPARAACERLNSAILARADSSADFSNLVSPVARAAIQSDRLTLNLLRLWQAGFRETGSLAAEIDKRLTASGNKVIRDGKPVEDATEQREYLQERAKVFTEQRIPHYRMLGIVGS